MKRVLSITLLLSLLLCASCGQKSPTQPGQPTPQPSPWQEQYDLGVRYLFEGNYEEAIIAFTAAIEIDSKRAETYMNLAYTYIAKGDFDAAKKILEQGYGLTNNEQLKAKLEEIESGNITDHWGNSRKKSVYDTDGVLLWYHLYNYAPDGTQLSATSYDGSGNQTGHVDLVYGESGERLVGFQNRNDDGAIGRVENEYQDSNPIKQTFYTEDGRLLWYLINEFDQSGNMIKSEQYWDDGTLFYYSTYEYDNNGNVVKDNNYNSDGTLMNCYSYEYDNNGKRIKSNLYNSEGNLEESRVSQYDEQGKYIGVAVYDGQGNLIQSESIVS